MVMLRAADQAESIDPVAPPTICDARTRQKYDPFGTPLRRAWVGAGSPSLRSVKPDATTDVNDDVVAELPDVAADWPVGIADRGPSQRDRLNECCARWREREVSAPAAASAIVHQPQG